MRFANESVDPEVVGVIEDLRQDSLDAPPQPEIFVSFRQVVPASLGNFDPILVIRTATDPATHVGTLRSLVREQAPTLALDSVMTMEDRVTTSLEEPRLYTVVLISFGAFAVLIAGVGLFGTLSFNVAQCTREIGVRCALGAQARDIVAFVGRNTLWVIGLGVIVGIVAALAGTRLLSAFVYGISPRDLLAFVVAPIVTLAASVIACIMPVHRATRVDPMVANVITAREGMLPKGQTAMHHDLGTTCGGVPNGCV
jgi:ABC-type antimicrobial peptide transport system permease subunit